MDQLRVDINQKYPNARIRWQPIGEEFWGGNFDAIQSEVAKLSADLSVVIVDPIALYDPGAFKRLNIAKRWFESQKTVVIILSPLGTSQLSIRKFRPFLLTPPAA